MITELKDTRIIGGDLIAIEAKYHLTRLVKLRNQHRGLARGARSKNGPCADCGGH